MRLNHGESESMEIEIGVRQGFGMSSILFNLLGKYLMKAALAEVWDFKIGWWIINKVRHMNDTAIMAKHNMKRRYG